MMIFHTTALALATLILADSSVQVDQAGPATQPAAETTRRTAPPVTGTAEGDDRVVCRRERVIGSNRPQRVCMTNRERARITQDSRDALNHVEGQGNVTPPTNGI